jgi:hypothetical protein
MAAQLEIFFSFNFVHEQHLRWLGQVAVCISLSPLSPPLSLSFSLSLSLLSLSLSQTCPVFEVGDILIKSDILKVGRDSKKFWKEITNKGKGESEKEGRRGEGGNKACREETRGQKEGK